MLYLNAKKNNNPTNFQSVTHNIKVAGMLHSFDSLELIQVLSQLKKAQPIQIVTSLL